ncbi:hypothetical protein [Aliiroseovarius halocynthiae]|uniref:hypothetical protein n=1 Tax=Aliiroseovarius halocynthiae TaxID=985055 RepID=UPI00115EC350|nr:hypothetical protein [Aliiroseovarius halocynthiae]
MVRALFFCFFAVISAGSMSFAGAWPREQGQVFLSVTAVQDTDSLQDYPRGMAYVEYGLRHNITLAGKITYDFAMLELTEYALSARWHFPENDQPLRKALSLTLAGPEDDLRIEPAVHLGRGFDTAFGSGWADLELFASVSTDGRPTDYGGYGVLGVKPHDRLMAMLGVDVMVTPDETVVKAIPSVAWELREHRHLTAQYTKGLHGNNESELGLGLWLQF